MCGAAASLWMAAPPPASPINCPAMNLLDGAQIARYLERCGLIDENSRVTVAPLSSDVALAACDDRRWVLKQALPKLKVAADWRSDVRRSKVERLALEEVARISPGSVPRVECGDDGRGVLVMQFVDGLVWKSELLAGRADGRTALALGRFLGLVHKDSARRLGSLGVFADQSLFYQLRITPYFERAVSGSAPVRAPGVREFSDADRCSAGPWGLQSEKCHRSGGRQRPDCIGLGGGPPGPPRV